MRYVKVKDLHLSHHHFLSPTVYIYHHGIQTHNNVIVVQISSAYQILAQFMQRCNPLGWLSRPHFEERWMQLLGVINQPYPPEGINPEEYQAHTVNVCAGTYVKKVQLGTKR